MLQTMVTSVAADAIKNIINDGSRFVVLAHRNPDGDAVGSSLALVHYLRSLGKEAFAMFPNDFPIFLKWMPGADDIVIYDSDKERGDKLLQWADTFFCLDFNALSRIGAVGDAVSVLQTRRVLIDHHPYPETGFDVAVSHPEACSTCELVFRIIYLLGGTEALTHKMAECIYVGMMTDTGNFAYASNRRDIYLILAELMDKGVDKDIIYRRVFYNYSLSRLRLFGYMMYRKLRVYTKSNAALLVLENEELKRFNAIKGDTEGLVNMPLQIRGIRFTCFLREEQPGKINVSLRSVDDFPCNAVAAEFFNGGGHKNASGGELHCTMDEAVEIFRKALRKYHAELTK